jgi:hypothetical protein
VWNLRHNNPEKAATGLGVGEEDLFASANSVFAGLYYGCWLDAVQNCRAAPSPDTASAIAAQAEGSPAVEPSPIPNALVAANKQPEKSKDESSSSALATTPASTGTQSTSVTEANKEPTASTSAEPVAAETGARPEETPAAVSESPAVGPITATASPDEVAGAASPSGQNEQAAAGKPEPSVAPVVPTTLGASTSQADIVGLNRQTWLVGGLLLVGIFVLAWVVVPHLRRSYAYNIAGYPQPQPVASSTRRGIAPARKDVAHGFFGGPRQVSLQLTASKPSLRPTALPSANATRSFDGLADLAAKEGQTPAFHDAELRKFAPLTEPSFESESVEPVVEYPAERLRQVEPESPSFSEPAFASAVGPIIEQAAESLQPSVPQASETAEASAVSTLSESSAMTTEEPIVPGRRGNVLPASS